MTAKAGSAIISEARVDVNVDINIPLPALVLPAPPAVVVIPGTYVYYAPDVEVDILFYGGFWYRPAGGRWYRSHSYGGPWDYLAHPRVPRILLGLPPDYRHISPGHRRLSHGELERNWKQWECDRHWDRKEKHREKEERHRGRGRGHR